MRTRTKKLAQEFVTKTVTQQPVTGVLVPIVSAHTEGLEVPIVSAHMEAHRASHRASLSQSIMTASRRLVVMAVNQGC